MAYAVLENSRIQIYGVLPKKYHSIIANVLGGFDKLPDEELEKHGFYPVEYPVINQRTQQRGKIYLDESDKKYKYIIIDKPLPSVESLKITKIHQLETQKKQLLEKTKDIVFEALELGEEIPTEIKEERALIRQRAEEVKDTINSLESSEDLLDYNIIIIIITEQD